MWCGVVRCGAVCVNKCIRQTKCVSVFLKAVANGVGIFRFLKVSHTKIHGRNPVLDLQIIIAVGIAKCDVRREVFSRVGEPHVFFTHQLAP